MFFKQSFLLNGYVKVSQMNRKRKKNLYRTMVKEKLLKYFFEIPLISFIHIDKCFVEILIVVLELNFFILTDI